MQQADGAFDITHQDTFGHFQHQLLCRESTLAQSRFDIIHQLRPELYRRDIHRHAERSAMDAIPLTCLATGLTQHPGTNRNDQTGFFRQ